MKFLNDGLSFIGIIIPYQKIIHWLKTESNNLQKQKMNDKKQRSLQT